MSVLPLDTKTHRRDSFRCGVEPLDRYLWERAATEMRKHVAVCYVLPASDDPSRILGYYSLSNLSVELAELPEEHRKKLPRNPTVPSTLIGRLAVDERERGKGFGELLLIDALQRVLRTSEVAGSAAVIVDPKEGSVGFYEKYGFLHFPSSDRLFLPTGTIARLFSPSTSP